MIDFTIPEETKAVRDKVRAFVQSECHPAEETCTADNFDETLAGLRSKARAQGLWCPFIPVEHGGMGLRPLANALVQMELGESYLGALSLNTQGPDDATMLTLLEHGTDFQKEIFIKPLFNGEKRICYSMTEKAAGADATGMQTTAVLEGDEWVLNGEKWFSSSASVADIAVVMAKTDPDAPRHEQYSTFIVELPNPGYEILRNIETMQPHSALGLKLGGSHSEIKIDNLRVPRENILGGQGQGFNMGQHRLAYGRLRHGMHNVAMAQRALDLAAKHVVGRSTFGERLADRQGVRWMMADCASEIYKARLMLLHIAFKQKMAWTCATKTHRQSLRANMGIRSSIRLCNCTRIRIQPRHTASTLVYGHPLPAFGGRTRRSIVGVPELTSSRHMKNMTTASACGGELFD